MNISKGDVFSKDTYIEAIKRSIALCTSIDELHAYKVSLLSSEIYDLFVDREYEFNKEFVVNGTLANTREMCKRAKSLRTVRYKWVDGDFIIYPLETAVNITFSRCFGVNLAEIHTNIHEITLEDTLFGILDLSRFPHLKRVCIVNTLIERTPLGDVINHYGTFECIVEQTMHYRIEVYQRN